MDTITPKNVSLKMHTAYIRLYCIPDSTKIVTATIKPARIAIILMALRIADQGGGVCSHKWQTGEHVSFS